MSSVNSADPPAPTMHVGQGSPLDDLLSLMKRQMEDAERRETRLSEMLEQALQPGFMQQASHGGSPPNPTTRAPALSKPVSIDRPTLLSSSTMSDFIAWEEAWSDYAQCQHLASQDRETRLSALRSTLDEDIRRFIRQGVISLPPNPDVPDVLVALKAWLRRQRNPLLDRLDFYQRRQQAGESFDSFFTSLHELSKACDFTDTTLCSDCSGRVCGDCHQALTNRKAETMRDVLVIGIKDDETRHKLLARSSLTLDEAIKICRAEEAASQTNSGLPPASGSARAHLARRSTYKKQKAMKLPSPSSNQQKRTPSPEIKHEKLPLLAVGRARERASAKIADALRTQKVPALRLDAPATAVNGKDIFSLCVQTAMLPAQVGLAASVYVEQLCQKHTPSMWPRR